MNNLQSNNFGFPEEMKRLERDFRGDSSAGFFWEEANYVAHFSVEALSQEGYKYSFVEKTIKMLQERSSINAGENEWRPDWTKVILEISDKIKITQSLLHHCTVLEGVKYAIENYNEGDTLGAAYFLTYAGINLGMAFGPAGHIEFLDYIRVRASATGAKGGLLAAKNRAETRENIKMKVKDVIHKHYLWNDAAQTAKSITDRLWIEIKTSIDDGNDWQGIAHADLLQAKVGRQSVYNAVTETDPR